MHEATRLEIKASPPQTTPEGTADSLVGVGCAVLGGPWFVELKGTPDEPVLIGPYPSRCAARAEAGRLRQYLAAVIRKARGAGGG